MSNQMLYYLAFSKNGDLGIYEYPSFGDGVPDGFYINEIYIPPWCIYETEADARAAVNLFLEEYGAESLGREWNH